MVRETDLHECADRLGRWLVDAALPLWWSVGADREQGGFREAIGWDGKALAAPRRARVQGRQSFVYALGGSLGWAGPWKSAAAHGLAYLDARYRRPDGLYRTLVSDDGAVADGTATLYDQSFALLAMATLYGLCPERSDLARSANALRARIAGAMRHPAGGFAENAAKPFQSNPHMHLLEASLAWCEAGACDGADDAWQTLADEIVDLAFARFIDPERGALREYFDGDWKPLPGADGRIVEPGHQFEWAWLLERWGRARGDARAQTAARRLFDIGSLGVDRGRGVAVDEMNDAFEIVRNTARLWPQTERLKAALILAESASGKARAHYLDEALEAARSLWRYLDTPLAGLWRDRLLADGSFVEEPAPASSLYHIVVAIAALASAART